MLLNLHISKSNLLPFFDDNTISKGINKLERIVISGHFIYFLILFRELY